VNQQSVFGRVLDQHLEERNVEGVEGIVALMSEDDRRAIVAHAIRGAMEDADLPRTPRVLTAIGRALELTTTQEQLPLLYAFLAEEEYAPDEARATAALVVG
jgi:hypothetical protein